jgi:hypothetical protein
MLTTIYPPVLKGTELLVPRLSLRPRPCRLGPPQAPRMLQVLRLSRFVVGGGGILGLVSCSAACSLNCSHKRSRLRSPAGIERYATNACHARLLSLPGAVRSYTRRVMCHAPCVTAHRPRGCSAQPGVVARRVAVSSPAPCVWRRMTSSSLTAAPLRSAKHASAAAAAPCRRRLRAGPRRQAGCTCPCA